MSYSIIYSWIYYDSFIPFSADRYLGCFQFGANLNSTGIDTVPFWHNVNTLVLTYMHFGRHMYAFLMGMSTYRSRSAGSQCRSMFNICRHYWTVFQNLYQLTHLPMVSHCTDWSILFSIRYPLPFSMYFYFIMVRVQLIDHCAFNLHCPDS